ncbi:hypothetical protein F8M41_013234 [Gigaspora margarita]|uniref:Uncharacterized protein n=1 Tax=Gigaspora margarita TaxID=4874 RepID=A0A8H3WYW4_GIGMA|nr:hypothetical protein F8M41_013234 [Gigaspora margarita]
MSYDATKVVAEIMEKLLLEIKNRKEKTVKVVDNVEDLPIVIQSKKPKDYEFKNNLDVGMYEMVKEGFEDNISYYREKSNNVIIEMFINPIEIVVIKIELTL